MHCSPARLLGFFLLAVLPGTAAAQSYALSDTTLPEIRIGVLAQTYARLQHTPSSSNPNGFRARRMRIKLSGRAAEDVDYTLQTEFVGSPALLDAMVNWHLTDLLTLNVGRYKPPFSAEQLASSSRLDFTERSRVVRTLAPDRQVGLDVEVEGAGPVAVRVGVFNGNAGFRNNNDLLFYVGRAEVDLSTDEIGIVLAGNAAASRDDGVRIRGIYDRFAGRRDLLGADVRLTHGPARLSVEYIRARLKPDGPEGSNMLLADVNLVAQGFHLTGAYAVLPDEAHLYVRWDHLDPGVHPLSFDTGRPTPAGADATDLLLLGADWRPTKPLRLQVSFTQPFGDLAPEARSVEAMLQLSF